MRKLLLRSPDHDSLLRLLAAWRVWLGGAVLGAVIASAAYLISPPPYRAQATVLVDQNVEQVILDEQTDLRKNTYLQRETDKLVEIAWSDQTLARLAKQTGLTASQLRDGRLHLSQPSDGGWHFLVDSPESGTATLIASAWAEAFVAEIHSKPAGISPLLEINLTRQQDLPVGRTVSVGIYIFSGALLGIALLILLLLFIDWKKA